MKNILVWGTTFVLFVVIRVILGEVGVYRPGERVGSFLDIFIFLLLLGFVQFAYGLLSNGKSQDKDKDRIDGSDQTSKE